MGQHPGVAIALLAGGGLQVVAVTVGGWPGAVCSMLGLLGGIAAGAGWCTNDRRALAGKRRLAQEVCTWAARPAATPPAGFRDLVLTTLAVERAKADDGRWTLAGGGPNAEEILATMLWLRRARRPARRLIATAASADYDAAAAAVAHGDDEAVAAVLRRYDWRRF